MRSQTIQLLNVKGKVRFDVGKASEDKYVDTVTYPIVLGSREGFYHFNPDLYTVEEASKTLIETVLKSTSETITRLIRSQSLLKRTLGDFN